MQDLGGEKTRRNSLSIILRAYVPAKGQGSSRRTTSPNVWAAYAGIYPASTLAPAYLAQLILHNEVAQEVTRYIVRRGSAGGSFTSSQLRRHLLGRYGERKVVTNSASAFLTTLRSFGVLRAEEDARSHQLAAPLPVAREAFPLLVWAWWGAHGAPQIDLEAFAQDPAMAFLDGGGFPSLWRAYQPGLWVLEERFEGRRAAMKQTEEAGWDAVLLSLVGR